MPRHLKHRNIPLGGARRKQSTQRAKSASDINYQRTKTELTQQLPSKPSNVTLEQGLNVKSPLVAICSTCAGAVFLLTIFLTLSMDQPREDFMPVLSKAERAAVTHVVGDRASSENGLSNKSSSSTIPFKDLYSRVKPCNGGYHCTASDPDNLMAARDGQLDFCDFDILSLDELSSDRFQQEYRNKKPFLLKTKVNDWTKQSHFTHEFFLNHFSKLPTDVGGSLDIVRYSGKGYMEMLTGEYMDKFMSSADTRNWQSEPLYTFTRISGGSPDDASKTGMLWMRDLKSLFTLGDSQSFSKRTYCLFMMGPAGSGTSFHFHQEAWTGLVFGRKRWIFYDPNQRTPPGGFYPSVAATQWLEQDYRDLDPKDKPLECMQHEGEMIYVPEGWFHAVVNVDDVVAISMQNTTKHTPELRQLQSKDLSQLQQATFNFPYRADTFFSYGRALLTVTNKNCKAAIIEFDKALKLDNRFVLAWVERSKCADVLYGPEAAADDLEKGLMLNPYSFSTRREVKRLLARHPRHQFNTTELRHEWHLDKWITGPFESMDKLLAANLDLEALIKMK